MTVEAIVPARALATPKRPEPKEVKAEPPAKERQEESDSQKRTIAEA